MIIPFLIPGERVSATNTNRALKALLVLSGLDPDLDFDGFISSRGGTYVDVNGNLVVKGVQYNWTNVPATGRSILTVDGTGVIAYRKVELTSIGFGTQFDFMQGSLNQEAVINAPTVFTLVDPLPGETVTVKMRWDAPGSPVSFPFRWKWGSGGPPAFDTSLNATNVVTAWFDGTKYYAKAQTLGA